MGTGGRMLHDWGLLCSSFVHDLQPHLSRRRTAESVCHFGLKLLDLLVYVGHDDVFRVEDAAIALVARALGEPPRAVKEAMSSGGLPAGSRLARITRRVY